MRNYFSIPIAIHLTSYVLFLNPIQNCYGEMEIAKEEEAAVKYIAELETPYSLACNRVASTLWDYMTNITEANRKISANESIKIEQFQSKMQKDILERFPNWRDYKDETLRRQFSILSISGPGNMTESEVTKMNQLKVEMGRAHATATVCEYGNPSNCTIRFDPEIQQLMQKERDPKIRAYYWSAWFDKMSELIPPAKYEKFLSYKSALAKANGFNNMFEMWMDHYDDGSPEYTAEGLRKQMFALWEEIRPMYEKLHAYVRMKLKSRPEYEGLIGKCGYIPAYQIWSSLHPITKPFPDAPSLDPTEALKRMNHTVLKMFQESDKFFTNLGLPPMTPTFWNKSMFERPADGRQVVCHPTAHDMCLGRDSQDFRIKLCGRVDFDQLITIHHEMGHVAYYQQYAHHNLVLRKGANPGFHEALGDALALSVVTPNHLQCKLGLDFGGLGPKMCERDTASNPVPQPASQADINFLYYMALSKLVSIPFSISVDAWRWEVFEGKIKPEDYNKRWWEIRMKNQGLEPPTNRTSPNLFDPAGIYHIVADVEYFRYFVSSILHFQFYEAMCIAAGEFDPKNSKSKPLYQCDFSGSKEAGRKLGNMMKLGMSKPWPEALETLTGSRAMSITPLKNYFQPLLDHIGKELEANGEIPGFGGSGKC